MLGSANIFIVVDRRITMEDISKWFEISMGTAHKIVHDDLAFFKLGCPWVPRMLTSEHKAVKTVNTISQFNLK